MKTTLNICSPPLEQNSKPGYPKSSPVHGFPWVQIVLFDWISFSTASKPEHRDRQQLCFCPCVLLVEFLLASDRLLWEENAKLPFLFQLGTDRLLSLCSETAPEPLAAQAPHATFIPQEKRSTFHAHPPPLWHMERTTCHILQVRMVALGGGVALSFLQHCSGYGISLPLKFYLAVILQTFCGYIQPFSLVRCVFGLETFLFILGGKSPIITINKSQAKIESTQRIKVRLTNMIGIYYAVVFSVYSWLLDFLSLVLWTF